MPSQGTAAKTRRQRSCVENGKDEAASHLQVREARALRRDQQASLLITAISILSDGTSASLGRSTRRRRIKKHGFSAQHRRQDSSAPWRWRPTAEIAKHQILKPLRQSLHRWHSSESSLSVEGIPPRFSSKLNDSKSTSRRSTQPLPSSCEEEALRHRQAHRQG